MKVLHLIDSGGFYGAEKVLLDLVEMLNEIGIHSTVASIGESGIEEKAIEKEGLKRKLDILKIRMRAGLNIYGMWKLINWAIKENYSILHSHGYKGNILAGLFPIRIRKIPLVVTLHGWTSKKKYSKLGIYEWLDSCVVKYADSVVLVNHSMEGHSKIDKIDKHKISVIYNGIKANHEESFDNNIGIDRTLIKYCKEGFVIGSIGRLSKEKEYSSLINAFYQVKGDLINPRLVILGEGPERGRLEKQIKQLALNDSVKLPGYKESVENYLSAFGIFVLNSSTEGLPLTILEAMKAGTPIIATKVGGIPEILEDNKEALLISSGDFSALTNSIRILALDEDLRRRISEQAKFKLIDYTIGKMAEKYRLVYNCLVN
jgi:glycosyltransferase involved in cell wall biosynthesis